MVVMVVTILYYLPTCNPRSVATKVPCLRRGIRGWVELVNAAGGRRFGGDEPTTYILYDYKSITPLQHYRGVMVVMGVTCDRTTYPPATLGA